MTLQLFGHPFSSYTWKALIALYEKDLAFEFRVLDADHPENGQRLAELWPLGKFPVLEDDGQVLIESSVLIEHLDQCYPGPSPLIPIAFLEALEIRFLDRVFDNDVMGPMQAIVNEHLPSITVSPDLARIERAKTALATVYDWLEQRIGLDGWACGGDFSLADCAAAPALFYADWVCPIQEELSRLRAYRARLLARPSVARTVDEARPYRHFFPLGAPYRD